MRTEVTHKQVSFDSEMVQMQGMDGPGMDGPAWKRQRMDDGLGERSRQDSVFYKTRMCHK